MPANNNISKNDLNKLLTLNDAELKRMLKEIAIAAGAPQDKTEAMLRDTGKIRQALSSMNENDAEKLISKIGRERAENVMRDLKGRL